MFSACTGLEDLFDVSDACIVDQSRGVVSQQHVEIRSVSARAGAIVACSRSLLRTLDTGLQMGAPQGVVEGSRIRIPRKSRTCTARKSSDGIVDSAKCLGAHLDQGQAQLLLAGPRPRYRRRPNRQTLARRLQRRGYRGASSIQIAFNIASADARTSASTLHIGCRHGLLSGDGLVRVTR